jgi:hypothetical protein
MSGCLRPSLNTGRLPLQRGEPNEEDKQPPSHSLTVPPISAVPEMPAARFRTWLRWLLSLEPDPELGWF